MSLLEGVIKEAFVGIKPSWRKLFLGKLKPQLNECFKQLGVTLKKLGVTKADVERRGLEYYIRPAPENIFNAFRFCEVEDIRCVIVGQDPYPDADHAHGLSFSVPHGEDVPSSLSKIYDCLYKQDIIDTKPNHGNLEKWAKQGVLLLNHYLTRNPQIKLVKVVDDETGKETKIANVISNGSKDDKNMHPFWSAFTGAILNHLCGLAEEKNTYLCLMLWGQKAQEMVSAIPEFVMSDKIDIKTWGHPSKASPVNQKPGPKNFENCTHFKSINAELQERELPLIDWDPREVQTQKTAIAKAPVAKPPVSKPAIKAKPAKRVVVFTDGGCKGNGKAHAKASYGVHFPVKFNGEDNGYVGNISGLVPSTDILDVQNGVLVQGKKKITPSNNRGELLGVIMALDAIIHNAPNGPWLVVMDSEYCMHIVNERIWKWHKKDSTFGEWANPDLVNILHKQLLKLKELRDTKPLLQPAAATHYAKKTPMDLKWDGLTVLHQDSHIDKAPTDPFEYAIWEGNGVADKLCGDLL